MLTKEIVLPNTVKQLFPSSGQLVASLGKDGSNIGLNQVTDITTETLQSGREVAFIHVSDKNGQNRKVFFNVDDSIDTTKAFKLTENTVLTVSHSVGKENRSFYSIVASQKKTAESIQPVNA